MTQPVITENPITDKSPRKLDEEVQAMKSQDLMKQTSSDEEKFLEYEKEIQQPLPGTLLWHKITFVFLGIASLAGWNAILTAFDFFQAKYPKGEFLDVTFYFPIPIMITNFLAGLACPALAKRFSYNQRIAYCLMGVCVTMILVTIIAITFNTHAGYWLSFCILFVQGFIDSVNTNSLIALAGMLHPSINSLYWTCTALSGLTMNIIRLIALAILGDSEQSTNICTAIYFGVAAIIYIISSSLQIIFTKSHFFQQYERRALLKNLIQNRNIQTSPQFDKINNDAQVQIEAQVQTAANFSKSNLDEQKVKKYSSYKDLPLYKYFLELSQVFKYAGAIPIYLILIYIQTFMMFPGVSIFQKTTYNIIISPWNGVYMIALFNLGDLVGKFIGGFQSLLKLYFVYGIVWFRFLFFILFLVTARHQGGDAFQNDVFAWFNMFAFAVTNGFSTTALMNLGPRKAKDPKIVNLINFIGGFAITLGISIGTFLALPLSQK